MFHSVLTVLTTAAIALHAMLGCCAHHRHSTQSRDSAMAVAIHPSADHCSRDHAPHHHDDDGKDVEHDGGFEHDGGYQHEGGLPHECDHGDCRFTSVQRSNDLELMLTFAMWCQTLGDADHCDAMDRQVSLHLAADWPPDQIAKSGTARAFSQVWRL